MEVAMVEPAVERDWSALPAGVLQLIMYKASTWQAPGSCLAAPVCRSWRSAAAGCKDLRLLYVSGQPKGDDCFMAWVSKNGPQLGALILSGFNENTHHLTGFRDNTSAPRVLQALAEAGEAAQAAGAPLALHTLRVLPCSVATAAPVDMGLAGRLLACLPHLRCLQLHLKSWHDSRFAYDKLDDAVQPAALRPLQQATQLQELYLTGSHSGRYRPQDTLAIAGLLPPTLKRLSWEIPVNWELPVNWETEADTHMAAADLSHLTGLTFLHLRGGEGISSAKLPPRLQQLELRHATASPEVLEEQQQVLVGWSPTYFRDVQQRLGHLTNLKRLSLDMNALALPAVRTALAQHTRLSDLALRNGHEKDLPAALATAGSISSLRSLSVALHSSGVPVPPSLAALTGLTRLALSMPGMYSSGGSAAHLAWAEEIGRLAGLRWLAVPQGLLGVGWAPLASLQQLWVLVVTCVGAPVAITTSMEHLLEGWTRHGLPPQLRLVHFGNVTLESTMVAVSGQFLRLRQLLRGTRCQLVVGVDLDGACDPAQQLAGLPAALQQVLA